ncbi:MAG: MFS transporter [Ardenticatenaceae bacterium]|nr:MFS transporter [Ardenticatenaceae bacterium]
MNQTAETEAFQTEQVVTIAGGHFTHDTFSAFIAPLLPLLRERLETNYALAGSLALFPQLPSLLNPFIGYVADKVSLRYFIILAPAVTATIMSFMGLAPNYAVLALLLLAGGVSIAAFHAPAPAMIGRISGAKVGRGMSIFMAAGELGRAIGPVFVIAGVGWFGLEGIWRLAVVGWLVSGLLYWRLKNISAQPASQMEVTFKSFWAKGSRFFAILFWLMVFRVLLVVCLTTYLPLYMSDVAQVDLWLAAGALSILEGAGVVGALMTGTVSDLLGRKRVLAFLLFASPLLMAGFLLSSGWLVGLFLILLGLTAITPTPVLLASVQDQFPTQRALANGMFLATNFVSRGLAIWLIGFLADRIGLTNAFWWSMGLSFLSLPAVWFLPQRES